MQKKIAAFMPALKGALIGAGAVLPGISGGVLMVTLGVYERVISLMASPFKEFKRGWKFYVPLIIGFGVGVLGLSRVVELLFKYSSTPAVWLFIGLIAGSYPSLYREAGKEGRGRGAWIALGVAFALAFAMFFAISRAATASLAPNMWVWLMCGALWGIGLVVPGMSPAAIFIMLDVYQAMSKGIADLSFAVILPMGIGLLVTVLLLSRGMKKLLDAKYAIVMHAVMGISAASTLIILPLGEPVTLVSALIWAGCFIAGYFIALLIGNKRGDE